MISKLDRWLTSGPQFSPHEITADEWSKDPDAGFYAPFDETECSRCGAIIGGYLYPDPETTADIPAWNTMWAMDEEYETLFCEDCWIEATEEVE